MTLLGELADPVEWPRTPTTPGPASDMARLFADQGAIHKFEHYLPVYEETFRRYRHEPVTMIEVGVGAGGSLQLWRRYFTKARIVGLDIRRECKQFDNPRDEIHVRIGAQQDRAFLARIVNEFGPAHIILDDGGHQPANTRTTFEYLFGHGLADGGVYLVEDLCHCYFARSRDGTPPFTDVLKELIDVIHAHYQELQSAEAFEGQPPFVTVPHATTLIPEIRIYDGIAVIRRRPRPIPHCIFRPAT